LRNMVERMAILASAETITKESIPLEIRLPSESPSPSGLEEARGQAERNRIRQVLEESGWNVSLAARILGIERTHLHKRIRALGINKGNW
jgi:two-component system, NtrC family, nitrogen regulation response regulator NtrX